MNLGAPEVLLIMLAILIFFGPKKIPDLAKGLGQGLREFRKASREIQEDIEREISVDDKSSTKQLPQSPTSKSDL
ncbi:MAG TPA: twin-arginine translocase TatA/TatE family subunit [Bacteroidota bacterium]|nr:twin-arginine translocase TatA/TatE family subunit [Bacteroidota bacterium]